MSTIVSWRRDKPSAGRVCLGFWFVALMNVVVACGSRERRGPLPLVATFGEGIHAAFVSPFMDPYCLFDLSEKQIDVTERIDCAAWNRMMGRRECHGATTDPIRVGWVQALKFANAVSRKAELEACYMFEDCTSARGRRECDAVVRRVPCSGYRLPSSIEWDLLSTVAVAETTGTAGPLSVFSAFLDPNGPRYRNRRVVHTGPIPQLQDDPRLGILARSLFLRGFEWTDGTGYGKSPCRMAARKLRLDANLGPEARGVDARSPWINRFLKTRRRLYQGDGDALAEFRLIRYVSCDR